MPAKWKPVVSQWYRHRDKGQRFQVTAIDKTEDMVEIQYFDGDVEEFDRDSWYELDIEPIEPPEDWTGPLDDIEKDDLGYIETDMTGEDWAAPLREEGAPEKEEPGKPEED